MEAALISESNGAILSCSVDNLADRSEQRLVVKEFFEHARPSSLIKRFASVGEVAAMVTYMASELSSATNGAALRVEACGIQPRGIH